MYEDKFHIGKYPSIDMEHMIDGCESFEDFEEKFPEEFLQEDHRLSLYLAKLLDKYDKRASAVSEEIGQSTSYVGHIINGRRQNPSRDVLLAICVVVGATVDETQYLLKFAGKTPLYVRKKRDVIIWFGLKKGETLDIIDENLAARGFTSLYKLK